MFSVAHSGSMISLVILSLKRTKERLIESGQRLRILYK